MTLSQFIRHNMEAILNEWQQFAETIPSAGGMDARALRNDAKQILLAIALDMESLQSGEEQAVKSMGRKARSNDRDDTAAESHGGTRFFDGFTLNEMVSEYRALRATVVRLWLANPVAEKQDGLDQLIRFQEGIDQALTESIERFSHRLNRSRELFMGILGHDLRTPLQVILQSTPVLLKSLGTAEQQRAATSRIERSAQYISSMVGDLLDVARTRLGATLPLDPEPMDADAVCQRVVQDLRELYPNRDIRYEVSGDLNGVWDAVRVNQLLSNLVRNALQHGDASAPVTVRAIGEPERTVFEVHNSGKPIPPTIMPHLFEPLVHGNRSSDMHANSGSMGLGLYIAYTIAKAHRGTLTAESSREHGTLFTACLPRTPNQFQTSLPSTGT
jgi:signal transduction histidine kinase